jgi:hypothetical protein
MFTWKSSRIVTRVPPTSYQKHAHFVPDCQGARAPTNGFSPRRAGAPFRQPPRIASPAGMPSASGHPDHLLAQRPAAPRNWLPRGTPLAELGRSPGEGGPRLANPRRHALLRPGSGGEPTARRGRPGDRTIDPGLPSCSTPRRLAGGDDREGCRADFLPAVQVIAGSRVNSRRNTPRGRRPSASTNRSRLLGPPGRRRLPRKRGLLSRERKSAPNVPAGTA